MSRVFAAAVAAICPELAAGIVASVMNKPPTPYREMLENDGDVSYRSKLTLGGFDIHVIPDTGSFELVAFSSKCDRCGSRGYLYDSSMSKTNKEGTLKAQQTYGSGDTMSLEAYDDVKVGSMTVKGQFFWEVQQANMPILEDATFQGIFGLGPPSGNLIIAEQEVSEVASEIAQMKKDGQDVDSYASVVQNIKDVAKFAKKEGLWVSGVGMKTFSFCLRQATGSPGYVIYNDNTPLHSFSASVDVVGETYWAAKLRDVEIDSVEGFSPGTMLGCNVGKGCEAILDTGTSLIAAPQTVVDLLVTAMDQWMTDAATGCTDLSGLPDLKFKFGGKRFTLPPESYVGEMNGAIPDWALKHMPHLQRFRLLHLDRVKSGLISDTAQFCVPLFMSTGEDPMWILGLPFFRKYYTMFELNDDATKAKAMHFAEADEECQMGHGASKLRIPRPRGVPLRIDPSKLIPPRSIREKRTKGQ